MTDTPLLEIRVALATIAAEQATAAERSRRIEEKLDAAPTMRDLAPITRRIDALENSQTWVVRSILGTVLAGVVGLASLVRFKLGALVLVAAVALATTASPAGAGWLTTDDPGALASLAELR